MLLQYSEHNQQPRVIVGVDEVIISEKFMRIIHSDNEVDCNIVFREPAVIYLESDDVIYAKSCNKEGRISMIDNVNRQVIKKTPESLIINGSVVENFMFIHIEN